MNDIDNGGSYACVGARGKWEISVPFKRRKKKKVVDKMEFCFVCCYKDTLKISHQSIKQKANNLMVRVSGVLHKG